MTHRQPREWHDQPEIPFLAPDSYTAHKLQHATPEHLYLTSRRFFIGPIPEGWLKSHRKAWYKHHLNINYSSRSATFSSTPKQSRQRRLSGLEGPSASALYSHSFPQPEELAEEEEQGDNGQGEGEGEPSNAQEDPPALNVPRGSDVAKDMEIVDGEAFVDAPSEPEDEVLDGDEPPKNLRRASAKSFATAPDGPLREPSSERDTDKVVTEQASGLKVPTGHQEEDSNEPAKRSASYESRLAPSSIGARSVEANSTSSLLRKTNSNAQQAGEDEPPASAAQGILSRKKGKRRTESSGSGIETLEERGKTVSRTRSQLRNLVHFDVPEDSKRAEVQLKAKAAQMTIQRASTKLRRQKIKDGLVVKMERMLVRVDAAGKEVPDDYDENGNQKIDSRVKDKWREYMVVCRQSGEDDADFVLQMYNTRVIPEIEKAHTNKRAQYEIPLGRKTTMVNLYSSLAKSVVVWLPVSRGTRIFILQARTSSNAVEWYTFLRNVLGWRRASELLIHIPDLSVSLRIENPFANLEGSHDSAQSTDDADEEAILRTMKEEQAVARHLIQRCLTMLEGSPSWDTVLNAWSKDQRIGLAWKRYDRLEWIHGANERKMYGTMAMEKSHELELRPKSHYPTTAVTRKKKKSLEEPAPVEGFLIRLTSQHGRAKRLGLMYHKQLYFSSHDQYLVFSRPLKVTPPPPPKLPASENSRVPTAHEISNRTPDTWAVNPYPVTDGEIEWLSPGHSGTPETRRLHDQDAQDEAQRKANIILDSDGYINLCDVHKVRKAHMGATVADVNLESGSDVDFDMDVNDNHGDDGATGEIDTDRTFELVMTNGLVLRLQAADVPRKKQWMQRLRALTKYWKLRVAGDISLYKSTRAQNLQVLNIDQETEAYLGQFARKWEVTQSYASPLLYNMCGIACCRTIHLSGTLYRKPRIHAAFVRCSVMLVSGTLIFFRDVARSRTGKELPHINHDRMSNLDLKDCYVYAGLLTENDLLYQNQTFDANKPGHHALPRIYLEDGWTSTDEDVMTTFVVWYGKSKSWFRSEEVGEQVAKENESRRSKLKRVAKLGSTGRSVVFRARSRAERDHWVLAIQNEIERVNGGAGGEDFRFVEGGGSA